MSNAIHAVETRSIEDSLSHGHDAITRAEHLASLLHSDLNGPMPCGTDDVGGYSGGIVSSADRLAGRLESLCRDLERIRARIVSDSPVKATQYDATNEAQYRAMAEKPSRNY